MTYETGTMNKTYKKIVVPDSAEICDMNDEQLLAFRTELADAKLAIESQISAAHSSGHIDQEWLTRSNGALAHMRRGLALIKAERERRSLVVKMPDDMNPAFEALDTLRTVLKAYGALVNAVRAFVDDDTDDNFDALERMVNP